jgi:hypothetical protein
LSDFGFLLGVAGGDAPGVNAVGMFDGLFE